MVESRRAVSTTFVGTAVPISTFAAVDVVVTSAFWMHWNAHPPGADRVGPPSADAEAAARQCGRENRDARQRHLHRVALPEHSLLPSRAGPGWPVYEENRRTADSLGASVAEEACGRVGTGERASSGAFCEADDEARTRDPQLGKLMLYQLSYVRVRRLV